jgi:2-hydroxy-3-keto-5-methylthiopentenyl-1-phosphate phosphatase
MIKLPKDLSRCHVFFDFDNTITDFDVLDDVIQRFSADKDWIAWEEAWQKGKIGSKECLSRQLRSVRVTKSGISRYLDKIRTDRYFPRLVELLEKRGAKVTILSDSFSFLINRILKNNGLPEISLYSNRVRFRGGRFIPLFPYVNKSCAFCANCKKMDMFNSDGKPGTVRIYIGDGLSDICPAQHCDIVFAKETLFKHLSKKNKECIPFKNLGDVYKRLSGGMQ